MEVKFNLVILHYYRSSYISCFFKKVTLWKKQVKAKGKKRTDETKRKKKKMRTMRSHEILPLFAYGG